MHGQNVHQMRAEIILSSNWMKKIQLHLGFHAKIGFPKNFGSILTGMKNFENQIFWKFLLHPRNSYFLIVLYIKNENYTKV